MKPLGWERTSTTLTDMDMNYLLLYLGKKITGLPARKKVQSAIKIVSLRSCSVWLVVREPEIYLFPAAGGRDEWFQTI